MSEKRAVVLGAAGFIGSHLSDRFLAEGWRVTGVDNLITGTRRNLEHLAREPRFDFLEADICEPLDRITGRVDAVLDFASPASPIDYLKHPFETLHVGSHGVENALKLAKRAGAPFVLSSTSEVYGDPLEHPQRESYWGNVNPIGPRAVYDEAKRFAEAITVAYRRYEQVDIRIARIFNTYGPRMRLDDGRIVPTFVAQALRGEPITVFGDGTQTRSFCYVDDNVEGIWRLLRSELPGPREHRQPARADGAPVRRGGSAARRAATVRSSTGRSPRTTRACGGRTSRARGSSSGGSRRWGSRTACGGRSRGSASAFDARSKAGRRGWRSGSSSRAGRGSSGPPSRTCSSRQAGTSRSSTTSRRVSARTSPPRRGSTRWTCAARPRSRC